VRGSPKSLPEQSFATNRRSVRALRRIAPQSGQQDHPLGLRAAAYVGIALALAFYAWLSPSIALGMLAVLALMVYPLTLLQSNVLAVAVVVFVLAWIGQFVGHLIEGRKPSFFDDIKFLLVGPAWLLGFIYRRVGISY
jgi:uncharacterized membrane protein YGL010W